MAFAGSPPGGNDMIMGHGRSGAPVLPEISGRGQKDSPTQGLQDDSMPIPQSSVHQEAADWVQAEEPAWPPSPRAGMAPPLPLSPQSRQLSGGGDAWEGMGQYQPVEPAGRPPLHQPRSVNMQQQQQAAM